MIRTSYMATHTKKQLTYVLEVFNKIGKQIGLVQGAPASFYPKKERKLKLKILRGKRRRIFKERLRKTTRRIRQRIRIRKHK